MKSVALFDTSHAGRAGATSCQYGVRSSRGFNTPSCQKNDLLPIMVHRYLAFHYCSLTKKVRANIAYDAFSDTIFIMN